MRSACLPTCSHLRFSPCWNMEAFPRLDTWIYGVPSDPRKNGFAREMARAW